MADYAGVSGSVRLTPQNWLNQRWGRPTATNKHTHKKAASGEPQAVHVQLQFPVQN